MQTNLVGQRVIEFESDRNNPRLVTDAGTVCAVIPSGDPDNPVIIMYVDDNGILDKVFLNQIGCYRFSGGENTHTLRSVKIGDRINV